MADVQNICSVNVDTVTLLLTEDNPADSRLIREMLKETGANYLLIPATTIKESFELLQRKNIDAVLLDLDLPDSKGEESFKLLFRHFENIPFIITSGNQNPQLALSLLSEGAQDFILKDDLDSHVLQRAIQFAILRKKKELKKQASHIKLFSTLYNETPVMLHSIDRDGRLISVSDYWLLKLGYERHEVLGRKSTDFLTENSRKHASNTVLPQFFKDGFIENADYSYVKKNGEVIDCLLSAVALKDGENKYVRSLAVITDITERKKTEKELERSRQAYKSLFDHNPDAVYSFDLAGVFRSANESLARMSDCTIEELIKTNFFSMVVPEDLDRVFEHFWKAAHGEPQKYETCMTSAKGRKFYVNVTNLPIIVEGNIIGVFGIAKDITYRKKAQQELMESEIKFRTVLKTAPDAIILTNEQMQVTYWNDTAIKLFGYEEQEILGKHVSILFPPGQHPSGNFEKFFAKKREFLGRVIEANALKKDGSIFPMEHTASTWFSDAGQVYCCFVRDITERKAAIEKIRTIIKSITDGFWITDLQGNILETNDSYCIMSGYSREELLSMRVSDFEVFESEEETKQHIQKIKESGYDRFVTKHRTKSGKHIDIDAIVTFSNIEKDKLTVFIHDITEQKQMEDTLRKSETNLRAIFDNTATGFLLLDPNLSILSFNKRGAQLCESIFHKDLNLHINFAELLPPERKKVFLEYSKKVLQGETISYETHYAEKDEYGIVLEVNCKPVKTAENITIGISLAINDISDRKKSEEKLIAVNKELETFIYKASHDLRSPLASILGIVNISKNETRDTQAIKYFEIVQDLAQKLDSTLLKLVQSLFIEENRGFNDDIDFKEIIEGAKSKLVQNKNFDRLKIAYYIAGKKSFISNKFILECIFQNLIGNAVKYQKLNIEDAYLNISILSRKNKIYLSFEDNGIGIEHGYIDRIFEMYFRATNVSGGSGLGLYIVRKGVEKLGGTISVQSEFKKGTTFRIVLPSK